MSRYPHPYSFGAFEVGQPCCDWSVADHPNGPKPAMSDQLTPTTKLNEAARALLDDLADFFERAMDAGWENAEPLKPGMTPRLLEVQAQAAKDAAAQTAAAVEALRPFAEYVPPNNHLPPDMPITSGSGLARRQLTAADCYAAQRVLSGLSAAAEAHDKAVAERAVQPWREALRKHAYWTHQDRHKYESASFAECERSECVEARAILQASAVKEK